MVGIETDSKAHGTSSMVKETLLKYGAIPNFSVQEESRQKFLSFLETCTVKGLELQHHTKLYVQTLYSLFANFCTPSPSIESIYKIVLLEERRITALRESRNSYSLNDEKRIDQTQNQCADSINSVGLFSNEDLPKDALVHVSTFSAECIITLLTVSPEFCLLTLPLEFQLSFARILIRLLSDEGDDDYDKECLFDSDQSHIFHKTGDKKMPDSAKRDQDEMKLHAWEGKSQYNDHNFETIKRQSYSSEENTSVSHTKRYEPKSSTCSSCNLNINSNNLDVASEIWSYASWKERKSSPLYSTIRFCSNPRWKRESTFSDCLIEKERLNFYGDNVKLSNEDEGNKTARSVLKSDRNGATIRDSPGIYKSENIVEKIITTFHAVLYKCLQDDSTDGQYLLLGPLAHLIGLIVSAIGVSVKGLHELLMLAEGSTVYFEKKNISCPSIHLSSLHIIRALRYAAEYSTQANGILDQVGPQSFFSFGQDGEGLSTILPIKSWPFKLNFCMACWFRAETFLCPSFKNGNRLSRQSTVLFSTSTQDGARIEVSLQACSPSTTTDELIRSTAATLIVTVTDAHEPKVHKITRKVRLIGCVLSPLVWYHIAIRMTKSKPTRFSLIPFSSKDEISIFLNGKVILTDQMKLPRFPDYSIANSSTAGINKARFASFNKLWPDESKVNSIEVSFSSNFNGMTGTLYLFDEHVSDETIQALYRATAGPSKRSGMSWFSFSDGWNTERRKLSHLAKTLSDASLHADTDDVILPNYPALIGPCPRKRRGQIDILEDDGVTSPVPQEFSRSSFASKLLLVWNPCRINEKTVVDLHSGAHALMGQNVSAWSCENLKDTIISLGGCKRLLPLFGACVSVSAMSNSYIDKQDSLIVKGIYTHFPHLIVPHLIFLLASFIREHEINARELYRCGGINVIEKMLHDCKTKQIESTSGAYYGMGSSLNVARCNASALLDLWQASRQVFALETIIFSQLLFNIPLLLGGVAKCRGVFMHAVLLPVLSAITRHNPEKVRDCIGTKDLFDFVKEYSFVDEVEMASAKEETHSFVVERLAPFSHNSFIRLTPIERQISVDIMFSIISMVLAQSCPVHDLLPLITFLTHNLDIEREKLCQSRDIDLESISYTMKHSRYLASLKALSIFYFLLQKHPPVPNLIKSLTTILESSEGVSSWMLCCLVNSSDDSIRGLGIKCLAAYLATVSSFADFSAISRDLTSSQQDGASSKITNTMKYGLGVISQSSNVLTNLLSGRDNVKVIYKLLWHLLKCHREKLGTASNSALMFLLLDNESGVYASISLRDIVKLNIPTLGGFRLDVESLDVIISEGDTAMTFEGHNIRNTYGVSTILRLIRFLSNEQKERWLFNFLALTLASKGSVSVILSCDDWQSCLFQLVAEVVDEINGDSYCADIVNDTENHTNYLELPKNDSILITKASSMSNSCECIQKLDTKSLSKPSVRVRYDLSLKLYSTLLGHCVRKGDEKAFESVEMAASLQRVDVNGPEVFGILLSHLFADLIEKGTVDLSEVAYNQKDSANTKNQALKQSARMVTQAILSNGSEGLDMTAAVKQWRCLRYLCALAVSVVTDFGFGITELFDYQNQDASATDTITGGVYGFRLGDNLVSGINAFEALAGAKVHSTILAKDGPRSRRNRYRYLCVVLASQVLTLLDAFIFPDNLDSSISASQLHGLSLVRSTEPRLGHSQGPLLASLVRLSLILLAYLEPCSVRFLQACSRLRCFLHWALEIIRESVALGGYSVAFHELTAPFDRLVLVIVLQCHRALSRCSTVLVEIESSPSDKHFTDGNSRQKNHRRLFRAVFELREILLSAYRGRNEVFRAALSLEAYEALAQGLEEVTNSRNLNDSPKNFISKDISLRAFLENEWVAHFHDVEIFGDYMIPEAVSNSEGYHSQTASTRGREAIAEITKETSALLKDYKMILDAPWKSFCEHQRRWAETDAVREMEIVGDLAVKRLSLKQRSDTIESHKLMTMRYELASQRILSIFRIVHDPWNSNRYWRFPDTTDLLFRKVVLSANYFFDDHESANYELTLGKEREKLQKDEMLLKEEEMKQALLRVGDAIVPYEVSRMEDEDELEAFIGWESEGITCFSDQTSEECNRHSSSEECSISNMNNSGDLGFDKYDIPETVDSDSFTWAERFVWLEGEFLIRAFTSVLIVTLQTNIKGTLILTSHNLYFHQTGDVVDVMTREKIEMNHGYVTHDRKWKLDRLIDIHGRRYMLKAQALELFFADLRGLFIVFNGVKERDLFYTKLRSSCKAPLLRSPKSLNPRSVFKRSKITELWRRRKLSNFQYLTALNLMAGRTFNDITQYPVFPWVLVDYESEVIDLSDPKIYRDLSKPVGALNPDRLAQLLERYNELDGFPEEEKFLYGSHYSSPGVILHYMVRQEPFTSMHIALQSGRFDCPDRLFFDLGKCWASCLSSTSDVKELTPEFFTSPEIFLNTNSFPLGQTQNKFPVGNVILPPWAKGSPYEFIRIHRLALESEYVSNNLNHWIDLIFGYKQRGIAAAAAHNVFHYLSYEGSVDIDKITDEVRRKAIEGHIQNFGQTPCQLLVKEPHPTRSPRENIHVDLFSETLGCGNLQCHTPAKQFGEQRILKADMAIVSLFYLGDSILVIHSDLSVCSYKLSHVRNTIPFQFRNDKSRKLSCRNISLAQPSSSCMISTTGQQNIGTNLSSVGNWSFAIAKKGNDYVSDDCSGVATNTETSCFLMSIGYFDDSIKVHSVDSLQLHHSITGVHHGQVNCIEVSDDGTVMVTGGEDATCRVWVVEYEALAKAITDGFIHPEKESFQVDFVKCCHVLLGHITPITCLAISIKLDVVVSASKDGSICLHNIRSGRFVRSLHVEASSKRVHNSCAKNGIAVKKLAIHPDGIFVAHLFDGSLYVVTVNGHNLCSTNIGETLNCLIICPQTETLITGGEKGLLQMRKLHNLNIQCTVDLSQYGPITSMIIIPSDSSSTAQLLCVGSRNGLLSIICKSQ